MLNFAARATLWVGALAFLAIAITATNRPLTLQSVALMAAVILGTIIVHAVLKRLDDSA